MSSHQYYNKQFRQGSKEAGGQLPGFSCHHLSINFLKKSEVCFQLTAPCFLKDFSNMEYLIKINMMDSFMSEIYKRQNVIIDKYRQVWGNFSQGKLQLT